MVMLFAGRTNLRDYHNFMEKESLQTNFELAQEFGLSLREIKTLKQKLMRN